MSRLRPERGARASRRRLADRSSPGPAAWLEREVPNVLAGFEGTRGVARGTLDAAWVLYEAGDHEGALALVLGEALSGPDRRVDAGPR